MTARGAIEIVKVAGLATVQDGGRPGRMHEGIPPGGALVPELLARANGAVGNAADEAGIEVVGSIEISARDGRVTVANDTGDVRELGEGERWRVGSGWMRVRYLAVAGGVDVPTVLGGKGTLLVAGVGGVEGRGLRRGDRIGVGGAIGVGHAGGVEGAGVVGDLGAPIRVVVGPDVDRFDPSALATLLGETFALSATSDRTGSRLVGPTLVRRDHDGGASMPMVAGAIEVPAAGEPIVLGPDHPTTGGYPVLAVVVRPDLGRFHARPVGHSVRFTRIEATFPGSTRV